MKGVSARFTLRTLARNRVRTAVTVAGVALSAAPLAADPPGHPTLRRGRLAMSFCEARS